MSVQEYVSAFFAVSPKTWGVSPVSRRHPGDWHVDLYLGIPCRTSVWNRHNRRELPDNPRRSVKCSKICRCIKTNKSINYRCLNDVFQPKMFKSSKIEKKIHKHHKHCTFRPQTSIESPTLRSWVLSFSDLSKPKGKRVVLDKSAIQILAKVLN